MSVVGPMAGHILDRPVWHALAGRQSAQAEGDAQARRYAPAFGPFAALADPQGDPSALRPLMRAGPLWLVEKTPVLAPPGAAIVKQAECLQMIAGAVPPEEATADVVDLGDADAGEMLALALATEPGPFAAATHRLGRFVGLRDGGRLIAMAGERMMPGGYTEVSGVCTDPDHRGRGHAGRLMRIVAARAAARGERPFLHCYAANRPAIALYERLGFAPFQIVTATVLAPI